MQALLDAIYSKCAATAAIIAAFPAFESYTVGYYRDEAPERVTLPYLVSTVIYSPRQVNYGETAMSQPTIQFAAYGVGHDTVGTKLKAFTDVFDAAGFTLSLSTGHLANCTRTTDPLPTLQPEADETGENVWQWVVTYEFSLSSR